MYTETQALEAIQARINGEYDNPELLKLGALMVGMYEDILRIIAATGFISYAASTAKIKQQ